MRETWIYYGCKIKCRYNIDAEFYNGCRYGQKRSEMNAGFKKCRLMFPEFP